MKKMVIEIPEGYEYEIKYVKNTKDKLIKTYEIKTYDDLIKHGIPAKGYYNVGSQIEYDDDLEFCDENCMVSLSENEAKSMRAMAMISQLMPYYGGKITDEEWDRLNTSVKYVIENVNNKIEIDYTTCRNNFLAFHTPEQRDEFIKYNKQLVKDYLMIV